MLKSFRLLTIEEAGRCRSWARPLRTYFLFAVMIFCLPLCGATVAAERPPDDPGLILEAAESVFRNMAKGDYRALWKGLSARTQRAIVNSVYKALAKKDDTLGKETIGKEFEDGGRIAVEYWEGYLSRFEPKAVLEESRWSMGDIKKDKSVIVLRHRKSENDALLMMLFERGAWRVGLHESFHTRQ
jgi:hypothetical protein